MIVQDLENAIGVEAVWERVCAFAACFGRIQDLPLVRYPLNIPASCWRRHTYKMPLYEICLPELDY